MGIHKRDRTKQLHFRAMDWNSYKLADQQIRQSIVKEEQRQDVKFKRMVAQGIIVEG